MAKITTNVEFHHWASPVRPVLCVERLGKSYRVSCDLRTQGPNRYTDGWRVCVRGKGQMFRRRPLNDGPTARAIISSVVCSAAWFKHVRQEAALLNPEAHN